MANVNEKRKLYPRIEDFYNDKTIFLTGASGFVGVVILEALLRCCPGIKKIFILLREKKGVKPEERKKIIFNKSIFNKLTAEIPDISDKACIVKGDISQPNLGISEEDCLKVCQETSIVFHCAAIVNFMKPQRLTLLNNFEGTNYVLQLCKKIKNLEALVYTSTAFSNCNRKITIEERIYGLPFPAQDFLDALKDESDEKLDQLRAQCLPQWPNHYTFSKCLTENLIRENSDIATAIIRPSVVGCVWKEPLRGYTEEHSTLGLLCVGIGKGFIRVYRADPDMVIDCIPVDVVANCHIVAAWKLATGRSSSPLVVNCVGTGFCSCKLRHFHEEMMSAARGGMIPNCFRLFKDCSIYKNLFVYRAVAFYEHYLPAYAMDMLLKIKGKKPKLASLYRFFDKAILTSSYFLLNGWEYETTNLKGLEDDVDPEDKEKFYTDLTGATVDVIASYLRDGAPAYDWKCDKRSKEERMDIAKRRYYLSVSIQIAFWICLGLLFYLIFSHVFL